MRRTARAWLAAAVLAAVAAGSGYAAVEAVPTTRPPDPTPRRVRAPLLSLRRIPTVVHDAVAASRLAAGLDGALRTVAGDQTCLVVRHAGRTLYERRPAEPLIPASTLKVLTAVAALDELGPRSRFTTEVKAAAAPANGVVDGDVWLIGDGDPLLATADYAATFKNQPQIYTDMAKLADSIVAAGVRQISGAVVGDESRYDTQRYLPTWKAAYRLDGDIGPASALVVNDGFVEFTGRKVAASSPPQHAAGVLTGLLQARGVIVGGAPGAGAAPRRAVQLAAIDSPPVSEIVGEMLSESDNLTAELLTKEMGAEAGAGTTAAGVRALLDALNDEGLPVDKVTMVDGSGLDRANRATCGALMAAVDHSGPTGPVVEGFAVANRTGTLARRFVNHPAAGRLRAKTGSLDGVTGLTGFVDPAVAGAAPLGFAFLANGGFGEEAGRALQERVGRVLAAFPDAPPPTDLDP